MPKLGDTFIHKGEEIVYVGTVAGGRYAFYTKSANLDCDGILKLDKIPEEKSKDSTIGDNELTVKKDGNKWCVLIGENLQEGIAGFGNTHEEAVVDFVKNYTKEKTKNNEQVFVNEDFQNGGVQWGISLGGPNTEHYFQVESQEKALEIKKVLDSFTKS